MKQDHPNQDSLNQFAIVAGAFCDFVDSLRDGPPENFYTQLELLLARLHVSILPVMTEMNDPETKQPESARLTLEDWNIISKQIAQITNKETSQLVQWHQECWKTAKPKDNYCAVRASMLWDDLADIYLDLKRGLMLWATDTDASKTEAAWEWRFGFDTHWGAHLARATQTVHEARYHLYAN